MAGGLQGIDDDNLPQKTQNMINNAQVLYVPFGFSEPDTQNGVYDLLIMGFGGLSTFTSAVYTFYEYVHTDQKEISYTLCKGISGKPEGVVEIGPD